MSDLAENPPSPADRLLPSDDALSAVEVETLLLAAGSDPAALAARANQAFVAAGQGSAPIGGCVGFQALFAAHRAGSLTPERELLLQDHWLACVGCRKAWAELRDGTPSSVPAPPTSIVDNSGFAGVHLRAWALGAAALIVAAALAWAGRVGMLPGQSRAMATVARGGGGVFAVADGRVRPVEAGFVLRGEQEIRNGSAPGAMVQLNDGTRLELGARADLMLTRGWTGTTVHLLGGQVIVQAAKQGWGRHLYVATSDSRESVVGTVFSVNSGLLGSRVAVIEGVVGMRYRRDGVTRFERLRAGEEATTDSRLALVPIEQEIGWSQNAHHYFALLNALNSVGQQIQAMTAPPPRYHSTLLSAVPSATVLYAALPNLSGTLDQADQILQRSLAQSPEMQTWWNQPAGKKPGSFTRGQEIEVTLQHVEQSTSFLGDEVVLAIQPGRRHPAVILAEVVKPGLAAYLDSQPLLRRQLEVFSTPAAIPIAPAAGRARQLLVWIGERRMAASYDGALLREVAAQSQRPGEGAFARTALYQRIAPAYHKGVSWIVAAEPGGFVPDKPASHRPTLPLFLVAEGRPNATGDGSIGDSATQVDLIYDKSQPGLAGLLGAPGPMGSLEFVSPYATMAVSALTTAPAEALRRLLHHRNPTSAVGRALQTEMASLAGSLGGEVTVAQDGPLLPTPAWTAVVEVNNSLALEDSIARLLQTINARAHGRERLALVPSRLNGQTYYRVRNQQSRADLVVYTFAGTYLVAGPSLASVQAAVATSNSGNSLVNSSAFRDQLPINGQTNFSVLAYHNAGEELGPLIQQLSATDAVSSDWRPLVNSLLANAQPGLVYAYAQPGRVELASSSGLLGMKWTDVLIMILRGRLQANKAGPKPSATPAK